MKYSPSIYAKAFAAAAAEPKTKGADAVKNFVALIVRNGDGAHLKTIAAEAERLIARASGVRRFVIESARPIKTAPKALLGNIMKPEDVAETKINPELVAGVKIIRDGEMEFDGSMKSKLDTLFGNT